MDIAFAAAHRAERRTKVGSDGVENRFAKSQPTGSVANQRGETGGMDAADHLAALIEHGLAGAIDVVLVHDTAAHPLAGEAETVGSGPAVVERMRGLGVRVVASDLADPADQRHHDAALLADALREVV